MVGHESNSLPNQSRFRKLGSLWTPAADGIAGRVRLWCINSQQPHPKSTANIVAYVNGVPVNNLQHNSSRVYRLCPHGRRRVGHPPEWCCLRSVSRSATG